jgi:hypothetical protein
MVKDLLSVNLVAYLMCLGYKPVIRPGDPFIFEFQDSPALKQACIDFYERRTKVDAFTLIEKLKVLKSMVHELKEVKENE